jgi:predicted AAA+ superfamily ATPase
MSSANLRARRAAAAVRDALADTRVVLVNGARQSGKSTLVRSVAGAYAATWRDLDRPDDRQAALADPVGFVEDDGLMVIDEIQRVPDLLLPIKVAVDADPRPGRYLLTGSSRLLGLRDLPDTLPGRMETIELWPFSQGEIDGSADGFVEAVFRDGPAVGVESDISRAEYTERVVRGGFPEAVARTDHSIMSSHNDIASRTPSGSRSSW